MSIILIEIIFLLIYTVEDLEIKENEYKINIIDNEMRSSYFGLALVDKNSYYIITGENSNNDCNTIGKSFRRVVLKFDIKSNILIDKYCFNSSYSFELPNSILSGENSELLLTMSKKSIEIYNWNKLIESENENVNISGKHNLIKIDSYYYNSFLQEKFEDSKTNIYFTIQKIQLIDAKSPSYQIISKSTPIKVASYLSMISCDISKDKKNIICIYYSKDDYFTIIVYDLNFNIILSEIGELLNNENNNDLFMKIVYFKDDNKFIIINSQDDNIIRLRYLKYINNNFINLLYPITDTNNKYIDIEDTQMKANSIYNDIIVAGEDKLIKVSTYINEVIISIFHFYEHDTLLYIKIYKMKNEEKITSNINPFIAMIKNSFIICLAAYDNNNRPLSGYFFINNPNSNDLTLSGNTILVKDLINFENIIYTLNLKLKIIEIPDNFILISTNNTSNYTELKSGDILEPDTKIILRQYITKNGPYIFKYKGIAEGNDYGYTKYKIYPSNSDIPESSEVYIEGREGHLYINFDECLEGYYQLDDNLNICTNKNPKGYYFDENEKIYKKCSEPCFECSGPYISFNEMNCISCKENFFITEDTNSCYNYIPINYILDNNILQRCYSLCTKCIKPSKNESEMNCLQCEYGYFLKEDTYNCIKPEEYKKREHKNISQMNSEFELLFIFILIFSIITAVAISLSCLIKKKKDKEELEIDNEENQRIFKDDESDINEDNINNSNMNDNEQKKENRETIN